MFHLDRFNGICNALHDIFGKIYVPNKTEHKNIRVFNMITRINELETLIKLVFFEFKYKFDGIKYGTRIKSGIIINPFSKHQYPGRPKDVPI